jgi:aminopeptidase N
MQIWGSLGIGGISPQLTDMLVGQRRFVVAHEVAHQWVPGLVGSDSQTSAIVDEPLAQYLAGRVSERLLGPAEGRDERDANVLLNYALYRLLGGVDGPAERPTGSFASTLEYGALVYGKAPFLYADLEERHGRAALDRALRRAVDAHAWRLVDPDGWVAALERGGLGEARPLARRWWREAHGDEDLGVDEDGEVAVRLMFGEDLAAQLDQGLAMTGLSFGQLLRMMMGGQPTSAPYQPGMPSPEEMLRLLEGAGR